MEVTKKLIVDFTHQELLDDYDLDIATLWGEHSESDEAILSMLKGSYTAIEELKEATNIGLSRIEFTNGSIAPEFRSYIPSGLRLTITYD